MTADLRQLVDEIVEVTGSPPPSMLENDAPVLAETAVAGDGEQSPYLIGLIGGKDVGKSALVNALVGHEISPRTSHGPGTEDVVAYAHEAQAALLRQLLEREVPGRFRIIPHAAAGLARQVLLDLPDIDSHYADHVQITRRMLRHMLYPLWIQSVEKYADEQPQQLLARVAAGNSPANFLFCLNKVDQLLGTQTTAAAEELRVDYARRLARTLGIEPPPVWLISAIHPDQHELPELRRRLSQERPADAVRRSKHLATRQQGTSILRWVAEQDLPGRAQRMARLQEDAEELVSDRLGVPLMEQVVAPLMDDPAYRLALIDECMARRVRRWPLLGLVHVVLSPLVSLARRRLALDQQKGLAGSSELIDGHLRSEAAPVAAIVQSTFAQLQQSHPPVSDLFRHQKLWEEHAAESAADDLRRLLAATVDRQRALAATCAARWGILTLPLRWLLTIGAVLWFPFVQPMLHAWLQTGTRPGLGELGRLLVEVLGVGYLLQSIVFLAIYFVILWLGLRWDTQRRITRLLARWKGASGQDPQVSLAAQTLQWIEQLLEPIRTRRQQLDSLLRRTEDLNRAMLAETTPVRG